MSMIETGIRYLIERGEYGGVLSDKEIYKRCTLDLDPPMIDPFTACSPKGKLSYGLSAYGYDVRLGLHFKVFDNWLSMHGGKIDPKSTNWHGCLTDYILTEEEVNAGKTITIPPNSFALAESYETFCVPRDIVCICLGKSSYARCGIVVNVTPLEPEWAGKVTIEISNTTPLPAIIYPLEGIMQVLFLKGWGACQTSYADKKGKYQNQTGLTMPSVKE